MQTIGIRELHINPAVFTKALEAKEYTMITKHSTPIGIALSLDDGIISQGLKTSLLMDGFKSGSLSLGQVCKSLSISKEQGMKMVSMLGLDSIDYDFSEDLNNMDAFV